MARPAQFDRGEILDKAMQAFWEHGYCATSMANLVETTDLKPGSLYAAFESKQGLFLATLDRYGAGSTEKLRQHLEGADSPLRAIETYFDQLVERIETQSEQTSCFLVNTVLELSRRDSEVREHINKHFAQIESIFVTALEHARAKGELGTDTDCEALAAFLMNNIWGLRVLAGTQPTPGRAQQVAGFVKQALRQ
ncbi:MAG: TetR/AcrR family transcriptional regulator [Gammaproteobacteria bacterium]|nr:TetR/AcrR family transcriptional regulator [Gammaproteobacteria bacterium]